MRLIRVGTSGLVYKEWAAPFIPRGGRTTTSSPTTHATFPRLKSTRPSTGCRRSPWCEAARTARGPGHRSTRSNPQPSDQSDRPAGGETGNVARALAGRWTRPRGQTPLQREKVTASTAAPRGPSTSGTLAGATFRRCHLRPLGERGCPKHNLGRSRRRSRRRLRRGTGGDQHAQLFLYGDEKLRRELSHGNVKHLFRLRVLVNLAQAIG
jgi:hypothetical protein